MYENEGDYNSIVAVVLIEFIVPSFKVTLASCIDSQTKIDTNQMLSLVNVIQHGLIQNGSHYTLNENYAKANGMTASQVSNLNDYLHKTPSGEVAAVINQLDAFKNTITKYNQQTGKLIDLTNANKAYAAGINFDPFMNWLKTVLWVFVGWQVAGKIVSE